MMKSAFSIILASVVCCSVASGQMVNTGQDIFVSKDALFTIRGDFTNRSGSFLLHGDLTIDGNWVNNSAANGFHSNSSGRVMLTGGDQTIGGAQLTSFPRLEIRGSGTKSLQANVEVTGELLLLRELNLNQFGLHVTNPHVNTILRTTGYINTDKGGKLIRNTNTSDLYLLPLGNAERYRPLLIMPTTAEPMTFSATMYNEDPTGKGYDVAIKRHDIKKVFSQYFYVINQDRGTSSAHVRFFLNTAPVSEPVVSEGDLKQLVTWSNFRLWEKAGPSTITVGNFDGGADRSLLFSSTGPITNAAFTFAESDEDPLTFYNAFSPDGDGKNDFWTIRNIDLYPDNDLIIFNRWGDAVFQTKSYSSLNSWDGGNANAGTYYYVLNVNVKGVRKSYKGFITMLKKD